MRIKMVERNVGVDDRNGAAGPEADSMTVAAMATTMKNLYKDPRARLTFAMALSGAGLNAAGVDVVTRPAEVRPSLLVVMKAIEDLSTSTDPKDREVGQAALLQMYDTYSDEIKTRGRKNPR